MLAPSHKVNCLLPEKRHVEYDLRMEICIHYLFIIIIIIRQPLCPVVGRRPQHVVSK